MLCGVVAWVTFSHMTNDIAQINPDMSYMACWTIPQLKSLHFDDFPIVKPGDYPRFHLQEQVPVDVAVHPGSLKAGCKASAKKIKGKNMKWFDYYSLFHMFYMVFFLYKFTWFIVICCSYWFHPEM